MALTVRSDAGGTFGAVQFNAEDILRIDGAKTYPAPGKTIVASGGAVASAGGAFTISNAGGTPILTVTDTNRIMGDFSNSTIANRLLFQSNVVNGNSGVAIIPNGTGKIGASLIYGSSDPDNSSYLRLACDTTAAVTSVESNKLGSGTVLPLTFLTGGAERLRILTDGNVLQGTTAPIAALISVGLQSGTGNVYAHNMGSGISSIIAYGGTDPVNGPWIRFRQDTIDSKIEASRAGTGAYTPMSFFTGGNERARISTTGIFMFGTTAADRIYNGGGGPQPGFAFEHTGSFLAQRNNAPVVYISKASGYTDSTFIAFSVNGAGVGSITTNGTTTAFNTGSDYRLKKNVRAMLAPLARLLRLGPVQFDWKSDGAEGEGFIAHELQREVPLAVTGEKDGEEMQGVDLGKVVPLIVAAVQELTAELRDEIDKLKMELALLKDTLQ